MKKRADGRYQKSITIDGKRHVFYGKTPAEINRKILDFQKKTENGKTFREVADEWANEHFDKIEYSTARRYRRLKDAVTDEVGDMYINEITSNDIILFLRKLSAQDYSSKTIKDQLSVIKMIFKYAVIQQYITNNVTEYITPEKGKKSVTRQPLTDKEIAIVNNSIDCTFGFFVYFLLYTGLRKGEALALKWSDIDFNNKTINVSNSVYHEGNTPKIKPPKTDAGTRTVILLDCLYEKLKERYKPNETYVFNYNGNLMGGSMYTRRWKKYQQETNTSFTAHQLRHTFATLLFEANINVKDAQVLMGHSDISVTQNIYTHIRQSRVSQTANALNSFISSQNN